MYDLTYQLIKLCEHNKDGSFETQRTRFRELRRAGNQLRGDLNFRHLTTKNLKPKHVEALVAYWDEEGIATSTIKTRMTHIRWWANKVGRGRVVEPTNAAYNIGSRQYISMLSKAVDVVDDKIDAIRDDYVRTSLKLCKAFGLRRSEGIKIRPHIGDMGDHLAMAGSWCKGGRPRVIPIRTDYQREVLDEAKRLVGKKSAMIPDDRNAYQQISHYKYVTRKIHSLYKLHGLRHRYAQMRYEELTGWRCPHNGGPSRRALSGEAKKIDVSARKILTEELGHSRISVLPTYIGS